MEIKEYISNSLEDTCFIAREIANFLSAGDVLVLSGDLGAGKTTFTKSLAKELDVKEEITSPTFTFVNEYLSGKVPLYHFDMYRIDYEEEAEEIGVKDYFFGIGKKKGICVVEWAENIKNLLPPHKVLKIEKISDTSRKFEYRG